MSTHQVGVLLVCAWGASVIERFLYTLAGIRTELRKIRYVEERHGA